MSTVSGGMRPIFCWVCNRPIRDGQYQITVMGPECAGCTTNLETPVDPKLAKDIATYDEIARQLRAAGYNHVFVDDDTMDMTGISLVRIPSQQMTDQEPILQFFRHAHLPERLAIVSAPFGDLARRMVDTLPRNPERTVALRKLLEAKDAAVRAELYITLREVSGDTGTRP